MATDVVVQTATDQRIADQVRRYAVRLAVCLIIGVNALFLLVLWGSGVDLDQIFAERDFFDPARDICLRMSWYKPLGEQDPVRLCKEWLNLGDPSGRVHQFNKDLQVVKGTDGKVYAQEGDRKSTRLNSSHLVISYAVFCLKKKKIATEASVARVRQ